MQGLQAVLQGEHVTLPTETITQRQDFFTQQPFVISNPNFGNILSLSRTICQNIIRSVSLVHMDLLNTKHGKTAKSRYVWAPRWACGTGGTTLKFFLQVLHNVN